MRLHGTLAVFFALGLSACGGGGGGGSAPPPAPVPTYVNTSSAFYLPLHAGNSWTFNTGSNLTDVGSVIVSCSCPVNGLPVEALNISTAGGVYSGTFYFSKSTSAQTGGVLTELMAVSQTPETNLSLVTDLTTYGLPVMDDRATAGETWNLSTSIISTITSVGQTQTYPGVNTFIRNVNVDALSGQIAINWNFAQGVGFTSLTMNAQTIDLSAFTVDALNSQALRPARSANVSGSTTAGHALSLLRGLF